MTNKHLLLSIAFLFTAFVSCKKDNNKPNTEEKGSINLSFENVVNGEPLVLSTKSYTNANGDTFTVNLYKYYISNIRLIKEDETGYSEPESYHLIDQATESSHNFTIDKIPSGKYTGLELLLGVDSTRNVSGAQTGALDPMNGMFWTWSTGYIMAKVEGKSPQSGSSGKGIIFHLGGYKGRFSSLKRVHLSFPSPINISDKNSPSVTLHSDIFKWFSGTTTINFATTHTVMDPGTTSSLIADNYANMLSIKEVKQ